jgi:hypothetical protein
MEEKWKTALWLWQRNISVVICDTDITRLILHFAVVKLHVFCQSLFVILSFFILPLYCMSFQYGFWLYLFVICNLCRIPLKCADSSTTGTHRVTLVRLRVMSWKRNERRRCDCDKETYPWSSVTQILLD